MFQGLAPQGRCFVAYASAALLVFAAGWAMPSFSQNALDGFDPNANGSIRALAVQADGKIVLGGDFTIIGATNRSHIARLNVDGIVDMAFNPGADNRVDCLALQADGKILVGGTFNQLGGAPRSKI